MGKLLNEDFLALYFEDILKESISSQLIQAFLRKNQEELIYETRVVRESVVINAAGGWEKLSRLLSKKFRKNIRNQFNKISKAGEFSIVKFSKPDDLPQALDCIIKISSTSWQGANGTGLFSRENTSKFYTALANFAAQQGWLSIWVLYFNNAPLAYEFHISFGRIDYALKSEFNKNYSHLSPGGVLDAYVVRQLADSAVETYDLLGYKESYKTRWSSKSESYVRVYAFRRKPLGKICHFVDFPLRAKLKRYNCLRDLKKLIMNASARFTTY